MAIAPPLKALPVDTPPKAPEPDTRDTELAELRKRVIALEGQLQTDQARAATQLAAIKHSEWAQMTNAQKTQLEADRLFGADEGDIWEVAYPQNDSPPARFPAHSADEAVGKYNRLCGITGTHHEHRHTTKKVKAKAA